MKKLAGIFLTMTLTLSLTAGCGDERNDAAQTDAAAQTGSAQPETAENAVTVDAAESTESLAATEDTEADREAEAKQLLVDLTGTYQELWPVILSDEYEQTWMDDCGALVGEDNAQAAYEKLSSMVTGEVYGEDAVEAYQNGGGAYFCGFTQGVDTVEFDGANATISGYDANGEELFSHTYHYIGMEDVRGLYEYMSDDADSGEFTYFYLAPDTNDTTYHIEFRYGSDADALAQYDAGAYAYWLASGISADCDETMIDNCIELFCTENLSE